MADRGLVLSATLTLKNYEMKFDFSIKESKVIKNFIFLFSVYRNYLVF